MKRGTLLVLAMLAAFLPPASAAAPSSVVYEVYRLRSTSRRQAVMTVRNTGPAAPMMWAKIRPDGSGMFVGVDGYARLPDAGRSYQRHVVDLPDGWRFLVAGPRGRTRIVVLDNGWAIRETRLGFRAVRSAEAASSPVGVVATSTVARAKSGPYGSLAYAISPCAADGVGTWTLRTDADPARTSVCGSLLGRGAQWASTTAGREWVSEELVVGETRAAYRLAVLDYPDG